MDIPSPAHTVDTTSKQHLAKALTRTRAEMSIGAIRSSAGRIRVFV